MANPVLYLLARFGIGAGKARRRGAVAAVTQETSLLGLLNKSDSGGRRDLGTAGGVGVEDLDSRLRAQAQEIAALRDALAVYSTTGMLPTEVPTKGDKRPFLGHAELGRFALLILALGAAAITLLVSVQSATRARDAASSAELSARNAAVSKETVTNIAHDSQNLIIATAETAKGEIATIGITQKAAMETKGRDETDQIEKAVLDGITTLKGAVAGDTDQMKRFQAETDAAVAANQQLLAREIHAAETRMIAAIDATKGEIATITNTQAAAVEGKGHDQTVQIEKSAPVESPTIVQPLGASLLPATPPVSADVTDQQRVAAGSGSSSDSPTPPQGSTKATNQERAGAPTSPSEILTRPSVSTNEDRVAAAQASPSVSLTPPLVYTSTTGRKGMAAAPPRTSSQTPAVGGGRTTRQCDAEYAANKAAIRASGQSKGAFVASCLAGNETIVRGSGASPTDAASGEIAAITNTQTAAVEGKSQDQTVQIEKSVSEPATIEQAVGAEFAAGDADCPEYDRSEGRTYGFLFCELDSVAGFNEGDRSRSGGCRSSFPVREPDSAPSFHENEGAGRSPSADLRSAARSWRRKDGPSMRRRIWGEHSCNQSLGTDRARVCRIVPRPQ